MNTDTLANNTWEGKNSSFALVKYKYLLSTEHLRLKIRSENEIIPKFEWYASIINPVTIEIQLIFKQPLQISKEAAYPDKLVITILAPALKYFKTLSTGALTQHPLETQTRILPP